MTGGFGRHVHEHDGPLYAQNDLQLDTIAVNEQTANDHPSRLFVGAGSG